MDYVIHYGFLTYQFGRTYGLLNMADLVHNQSMAIFNYKTH